MNAVDAAIGPEIENDDLSAQLSLQREGGGIEPILALGKIGSLQLLRQLVHLLNMLTELTAQHGRAGLGSGQSLLGRQPPTSSTDARRHEQRNRGDHQEGLRKCPS